MISLLVSFAVLILGYAVYSRVTEKVFAPDDRETPAIRINDGVDCVPMKTWRAFLVQLLNIAGTGPVFGALMGAQFGPVVFLWIVFGSILGGAVHDYMTGMISCRCDGSSIVTLSGRYLGKNVQRVMRVFSVVLLVLVGTVFITSPAALLAWLSPEGLDETFWILIIIAYYIFAALLPIDKLIGRLYPVFGVVLLAMAAGILGCILFTGRYDLPELTLRSLHPQGRPVWPYMFVTVACGAISGFHATQSPMVAKCITSERKGRTVFYGAMIGEAMIALAWAAAGVAFYGATGGLSDALSRLGQSGTVYEISLGMLGTVGGIFAVIGVIACPISSGDTAFRSARLILAEWAGWEQKTLKKRLVITVPLLLAGLLLTRLNFDVLWRYFSWSNQTLAMISLWVAAVYLEKEGKPLRQCLLAALPAAFMSAVSLAYILTAEEGLRLPAAVATPVGMAFALILFVFYLRRYARGRKKGFG